MGIIAGTNIMEDISTEKIIKNIFKLAQKNEIPFYKNFTTGFLQEFTKRYKEAYKNRVLPQISGYQNTSLPRAFTYLISEYSRITEYLKESSIESMNIKEERLLHGFDRLYEILQKRNMAADNTVTEILPDSLENRL